MIKFDERKAGKDTPENWILTSIAITGHFEETDSQYATIPDEIKDQMYDLHIQSEKGKVSTIKRLERLIQKYPRVPALYNYLSISYMNHGNRVQAQKILDLTFNKFPDYHIARINKVGTHIFNREFEKAEALLGSAMEITEVMPNRKKFHISEVMQYYEATIKYLIVSGNIKAARSRLNMLKGVSEAFKDFHKDVLENYEDDIKESFWNSLDIKGIRKPWVGKSKERPIFNHSEIEWLYGYDFDMPKEKIDAILALPRPTLIQDLHKVIDDAMARFDVYEDKDWDEKTHSFPAHALLLLGELHSTESLSHTLNLVRQDDEWASYWFADMITEVMPMIYYKMIGKDLSILKNYLLEPNNEAFHRMSVTTAISILAYHHPDRKSECIRFLEDILNDFYENLDKYKNVVDWNLIESIIGDLSDLKAKESLPTIKKFYDEEIIPGEMISDWDELIAEMEESENSFNFFDKVTTIYEDYEKVNGWNKPVSEEQQQKWDAEFEKLRKEKLEIEAKQKELNARLNSPSTKMPDVGRNDPCPCGSGKKFKKCHGV